MESLDSMVGSIYEVCIDSKRQQSLLVSSRGVGCCRNCRMLFDRHQLSPQLALGFSEPRAAPVALQVLLGSTCFNTHSCKQRRVSLPTCVCDNRGRAQQVQLLLPLHSHFCNRISHSCHVYCLTAWMQAVHPVVPAPRGHPWRLVSIHPGHLPQRGLHAGALNSS